MACAAAEVFMDFNSGEKTEAVSAATLLYHGWDASRVRGENPAPHGASTNPSHRKWQDTASKTPTSTFNS